MPSHSNPAPATPSLESFGERLKYCRKEAKLTQGDVAATLGLTQGSVTQYEQGKIEPSISNLAALAGIFEVSMEWLVTGGATIPVVPVKASPSRNGPQPPSIADSMLTPVQQATVDLLRTVAKAGLLPNAECLGLMTDWQGRLDKKQQL